MQANTLQPVWNELWHVKNVPTDATLAVQVMDKDEGKTDDFVGKFETTVAPGAKEAVIQGPLHRRRGGTFWLQVRTPLFHTHKLQALTHARARAGRVARTHNATQRGAGVLL